MRYGCRRMAVFPRSRTVLWLAAGLLQLAPSDSAAQVAPEEGSAQVRWWHGVAALGGYAALIAFDDGIKGFSQDHRSRSLDGLSSVARQMGRPEVYVTTGLGILATGLVSGNRGIRDAGARISASLALTGAIVYTVKFAAGRSRPSERGTDSDDFYPFSGRESAPSGHAAMAFAMATSLGDEIGNPWVSAGLYVAASTTAWSRVNDDLHWFSDVVAGAAIGVVTARFVNGKLTLFGLKAPNLGSSREGLTLSWQGEF